MTHGDAPESGPNHLTWRWRIAIGNDRIVEILAEGGGAEGVLRRVAADDAFARALKLESLRETLTLDYPSYIFALAMGAGKTILIGAIIAAESAMICLGTLG